MERSSDRVLRLITVVGWIPAMAFSIAHGVIASTIFPALGTIPMSFSCITGLVHLTGYAKRRSANILMDLFVACFLISILVPTWVKMADGSHWWYPGPGVVMLGTYGTMPMMISFVIHSYFVLREITFGWLGFGEKTCPNCHCNISHNRRAPRGYRQAPGEYEDAQDSDDSKETFHPAQMTKDQQQPKASSSKEPRPSTDDETARLV